MMSLYGWMSPAKRVQIRKSLDAWRTRPGKGIRNREKTECPRGHPYDTVIQLAGRKQTRRCRRCYNESMRRFMERRRQRATP